MNSYNPETHQYFIDGVEALHVTEILELAGIIEKRFYTEGGRTRGQLVHQITQYLDEGDLEWSTVDPSLEPYVRAYELFKEETGFVPELIETQVYNPFWGYAGTLDRTGTIDGKKVLIDIKTGYPSKWAALQTAAYAFCLDELYDRKVICLKPDGKYKPYDYEDPDDFEVFVSALKIAKWKKNGTNKTKHSPARKLPDEMDQRGGGGRECVG